MKFRVKATLKVETDVEINESHVLAVMAEDEWCNREDAILIAVYHKLKDHVGDIEYECEGWGATPIDAD